MNPRLLLVEKEAIIRGMLQRTLERDAFDVIAVATARDAAACIDAWEFDVLLCKLHMPLAGDGFTIVSALNHTHPRAVTLVLNSLPELDLGLPAIHLQSDEMNLASIAPLGGTIREKLAGSAPYGSLPKRSMAALLVGDLQATTRIANSAQLKTVAFDYLARALVAAPASKELSADSAC
jgi:CheY-like chemotaxis protein